MKKILTLSLFLVATFAMAQGPATTDLNWEPKLTFKETTFDFGNINEGADATHLFKFTNNEKFPVTITNATAGCSCTVPSYPKQAIAPGKSADITVKYDTKGKNGSFNKDVTLTFKDNTGRNTGTKKLYITGSVNAKNLK